MLHWGLTVDIGGMGGTWGLRLIGQLRTATESSPGTWEMAKRPLWARPCLCGTYCNTLHPWSSRHGACIWWKGSPS